MPGGGAYWRGRGHTCRDGAEDGRCSLSRVSWKLLEAIDLPASSESMMDVSGGCGSIAGGCGHILVVRGDGLID